MQKVPSHNIRRSLLVWARVTKFKRAILELKNTSRFLFPGMSVSTLNWLSRNVINAPLTDSGTSTRVHHQQNPAVSIATRSIK